LSPFWKLAVCGQDWFVLVFSHGSGLSRIVEIVSLAGRWKTLTHFWIFPLWIFEVWFSTLVMRVRFHTSPEARMVWSNFFFPRCQIFPMFCWWHRWTKWPFLKTWFTFRSHSISSQEWKIQKNVLKFTLYHKISVCDPLTIKCG
jgi:hypothetical protein